MMFVWAVAVLTDMECVGLLKVIRVTLVVIGFDSRWLRI